MLIILHRLRSIRYQICMGRPLRIVCWWPSTSTQGIPHGRRSTSIQLWPTGSVVDPPIWVCSLSPLHFRANQVVCFVMVPYLSVTKCPFWSYSAPAKSHQVMANPITQVAKTNHIFKYNTPWTTQAKIIIVTKINQSIGWLFCELILSNLVPINNLKKKFDWFGN